MERVVPTLAKRVPLPDGQPGQTRLREAILDIVVPLPHCGTLACLGYTLRDPTASRYAQLAAAGISPGLMRVAVGLEPADVLLDDLRQAIVG